MWNLAKNLSIFVHNRERLIIRGGFNFGLYGTYRLIDRYIKSLQWNRNLLYHSVHVDPKRLNQSRIKKFNKTMKNRLTNDANYQQQLRKKIVRFWSDKKTPRNSDSLTCEFHSGCKNHEKSHFLTSEFHSRCKNVP